jgi:hypothetical protein
MVETYKRFCDTVKEWDLVYDDDQPIPLDVDVLMRDVGFSVIMMILQKVQESDSVNPNQ